MKNRIKFLPLVSFVLVTFTFMYIEANAQSYLPVGPQTNVPVATVTNGGWTECYSDLYINLMDSDEVLSDCPGSLLMLACRPTGSDTLTLLAQGDRSDVTFDTGNNADETHTANGVAWYFSSSWLSWGFASEGDTVNKNICDNSAQDEVDRLCWHIDFDAGGWRCGDNTSLNESTAFERIVYYMDEPTPSTAIPTISEWGLIAMAGILGIVGFMVLRRKKVTA